MKRFFTLMICLCVTVCSAFLSPRWANADDGGKWLLGYAGTAASNFIWDSRSPALLQEVVPSFLLTQVSGSLGGPADDVQVEGNRYVALSACDQRRCYQKAFLWVDTKTGASLTAYAEPAISGGRVQYNVTLASKTLFRNNLPAQGEQAFRAWLTAWDIQAVEVRFVDPVGAVAILDGSGAAHDKSALTARALMDIQESQQLAMAAVGAERAAIVQEAPPREMLASAALDDAPAFRRL